MWMSNPLTIRAHSEIRTVLPPCSAFQTKSSMLFVCGLRHSIPTHDRHVIYDEINEQYDTNEQPAD